MPNELRPYQRAIRAAVMDSVHGRKGLTFTVEIARQGGKNELSAWIEAGLLAGNTSGAQNLVKCSPTFAPQAIISMTRLKHRLDAAGFAGRWSSEHGYIIRLGYARAIFLSAEDSPRVVGHTAHLLLEIDESQDVSKDKYSKEFKPMAATTNATTVLYGTAWDDSTLLEETKQTNLDLGRKDGAGKCGVAHRLHRSLEISVGFQSPGGGQLRPPQDVRPTNTPHLNNRIVRVCTSHSLSCRWRFWRCW